LEAIGAPFVQTVSCRENALAVVAVQPLDLLIFHWRAHHKDGLLLVRQIRADFEGPVRLMPIVVMAAEGGERRQEALAAGASEFVPMPFTPAAFLGKLQEAVFRPRPFIEAKSYTGPDRRRRLLARKDAPKRRKSDVTI
jgi:CheY-like chemotaxis protein